MRVEALTLATAALTFGLASPALASPMLGDHQGMRTQALLQRGGDDCDDDGGCGDGDSDSFSGHRHCGSFSSCRGMFGHGPLSGFGGGGWGGGGGGGGGDRVEWGESGSFGGGGAARHARVSAH